MSGGMVALRWRVRAQSCACVYVSGCGKDFYEHFLMLALGYPQFEQVCFCTWRERLPVCRHPSVSCLFFLVVRRVTGLDSVHTATSAEDVGLVVTLSETGGTLGCLRMSVSCH